MAQIVTITNPLTGQPAQVDQLEHTAQQIDDAITRSLPGGAIDITLANKLGGIESTEYPGCYYRMAGSEKEWLNPPMRLGDEYRTMERYLGKPVYKRMIDFGTLPSSGSKEVSVPDADDVMRNISIDLSKSVCTKTGFLHTNLFPSHPSISGFYFNVGTVRIETTKDYSSWSAQICISYTKSTD